jgi:hypothetical protein
VRKSLSRIVVVVCFVASVRLSRIVVVVCFVASVRLSRIVVVVCFVASVLSCASLELLSTKVVCET